MSGISSYLDVDSLRAATFVGHVEIHNSLPTTSDRAIELAGLADLETPALVVARYQTAGRGRGDHRWWSADGALTFSLVLDTVDFGVAQRHWPRLSLATAVAVCDALQPYVPVGVLAIKWPNDVLIDGAKVCGILIESPGGTAAARDRLVVGIGINVNNSWRSAPHDAGPKGTALCDFANCQHDLAEVLIAVLNALHERVKQLSANDPALSRAWQERNWLTNQLVEVETGGIRIGGVSRGIADDGALLVQSMSAIERIYSGSITVTRSN